MTRVFPLWHGAYVSWIVLLLGLWSAPPAQAAEEPLYTQLTRGIFRLQVHKSTCTAGQAKSEDRLEHNGTGFFVIDYRGEQPVLWVVTARHVVDAAKADLIAKVRLDSGSGQPTRDEWLYLPRSKWFVLDEGVKEGVYPIDVAVMPIQIKDYDYKAFTLCKGDNCPEWEAPKTGRVINQLGENPQVPEKVLLFGFPQEGPDSNALEPFTRGGIVSYSSRDARFRIGGKPMVDLQMYVIDAFGWPGNSGGPVMNDLSPFSPNIRLLGLLTGSHFPSHDFSIITPVSSILRTLDGATAKGIIPISAWRKQYELAPRSCETRP